MKKLAFAIAAVGIALMGLGIRGAHADSDSLYIGDEGQDTTLNPPPPTTPGTVKRFDARTGKYLGVFVTNNGCPTNPASPPPSCLYGPTGLIFDRHGHLLVNNQNANLPVNGAINEYDHTGAFVKALVPNTLSPTALLNDGAPPAPRGIILNHNALFVPSLVGYSFDPTQPGLLQAFNRASGAFRRALVPPAGLIPPSSFHPRGVVIGPDGLLYVSNDPVLGGTDGDILRFYPATGNFKDVFVSNANPAATQGPCSCDFNRPEGLVFGPDGNLYVTSFAKFSSTKQQLTSDKILIFAGPYSRKPGKYLAKIDLDQVGHDLAFAQALLFGPEGRLFVPITAFTGGSAGQVRRYNVNDRDNISYDIFVPAGLIKNTAWFYLTFGNTDPATLNYTSPE